MSSLVEGGIRLSISALVQKDRGAAEEVFKNESRINTIELEIDGLVIELLALQSLLAATRNLERLADHATNIAEDVLFYAKGIDIRHNSGAGSGTGQR